MRHHVTQRGRDLGPADRVRIEPTDRAASRMRLHGRWLPGRPLLAGDPTGSDGLHDAGDADMPRRIRKLLAEVTPSVRLWACIVAIEMIYPLDATGSPKNAVRAARWHLHDPVRYNRHTLDFQCRYAAALARRMLSEPDRVPRSFALATSYLDRVLTEVSAAEALLDLVADGWDTMGLDAIDGPLHDAWYAAITRRLAVCDPGAADAYGPLPDA